MNERIQELAYQAEDYADSIVDQGGEFHQAYTRKFAELIIRECAKFVEDKFDFIGDEIIVKEKMLEHFGVEE